MEGTYQVSGAAGGADNRADVRRRLADLAAVERQACVERAEEAFVSADRGNPASMLRPIQLLAQGVGGTELEALVGQWDTLSTAQQQQAFGVALMLCDEGTWQAQMWRLQLSQFVAVPAQEELSGPAISVEGTEQGPADTAAERTVGALALAVLATAGPPQLAILVHLEQGDKMTLGATCTSLRQASLAWFLEVTAEVVPDQTDVTSLAAWLERHQACLHLIVDRDWSTDYTSGDEDIQNSRVEWNDSLAALPTSLVTSLAVRPPFGLRADVSALTALTRLELVSDQGFEVDSEEDEDLPCSLVSSLRPLNQLRQLSMVAVDLSGNADDPLSLPALAGLLELELRDCRLQACPPSLSSLTHLTFLALSGNLLRALAPLAILQRLQSLDLTYCGLTAVPAQLSALTALARLNFADNSLASGWQHLVPLSQLQDLMLKGCSLEALPQQLSALPALTRLILADNGELAGGWQHLLPPLVLQDLDLGWCRLTAVPQQLSGLTTLTRLILRSNRLEIGWQHLVPLTQLQDLCLASCNLTAVPQQLSALTALTHLDLAHNNELPVNWPLLPLSQLRDLDLSWCCLTAVPEQLSALTALTRLNLHHNKMLAGDWPLLPLSQLRDLDLRWCCLTAVPQQLSALTALTRLNLRSNRLETGWQHLLPLAQLQDLNLQGVPLPGGVAPPELAVLTQLCIALE